MQKGGNDLEITHWNDLISKIQGTVLRLKYCTIDRGQSPSLEIKGAQDRK